MVSDMAESKKFCVHSDGLGYCDILSDDDTRQYCVESPCPHEELVEYVPVVHGYHEGDVCIYGFGHENKSRAIVEIVRILDDERGVAEVKFHKVFVDDTGNGFFNYLLKSGNTMNASFQYLKNITPRIDGCNGNRLCNRFEDV